MWHWFPLIRWVHPHGDWPSFSPDGQHIVFTQGSREKGYYLSIMDADGSNETRLYPPEGTTHVRASRPDWSWNPTKIAFTRESKDETTIYTIAPDGTGAAPYSGAPVPSGAALYYPSWHKDLSGLVAVGYSDNRTRAVLYELTPTTCTALTRSPDPCAGRPSISPDGKQIAFAGNQGHCDQVQNEIWVVAPPKSPYRLESAT